jgi:rhomboid protease GluP
VRAPRAIICCVFTRQRSGSVICASCRQLVGVNDAVCYNCGRRNPGLWGFSPALRALGNDLGFTPFVVGSCIVLYVFTLLASGGDIGMNGLFTLFSPSRQASFLFGASGAIPVFGLGRWWTVLSAGWLHGGLLHIVFNMLTVRQLAPAVAELYGASRMVIIYVVAGAVGFALSSFAGAFIPGFLFLQGGFFTVGASAPIFGLLGALVYYGRRGGSSHISSQAISYTITLGIFGFVMPGVDNYAHAGGFGGGYLAARILDPLLPERLDHLLIALGCIAVSFLAIVFSVIHGLQFFR